VIIGHDRNLPSPSGGVNHIGWHSKPGGMTPQAFNDFNSFGHRRTEVTCPSHQITLIEIIRAHAYAYQFLHQVALDMDTIINACQ